MKAGTLRHRVMIQQPTRTTNSVGEAVITWADYKAMWCNIRPVTARETMRANQPLVDTSHLISARYNPWLQSDYRLKWEENGNTHYFNITGIIDVENRHKEFEISASETTDG